MPNTALRNHFFIASVAKKYNRKITKRELVILCALDITGSLQSGQRLYSLHRYLERNSHAWSYRNFKKIMDGLLNGPYVKKVGITYLLTLDGTLLLTRINKQLQKLSTATVELLKQN